MPKIKGMSFGEMRRRRIKGQSLILNRKRKSGILAKLQEIAKPSRSAQTIWKAIP